MLLLFVVVAAAVAKMAMRLTWRIQVAMTVTATDGPVAAAVVGLVVAVAVVAAAVVAVVAVAVFRRSVSIC